MKPVALLLGASLALNATLAALAWRPAPAAARPGRAEAVAAQTAAQPVGPTPTAAPAGPAPRAPLWSGFAADDLDAALARLRAAGCPPRELVAVIQALIAEREQQNRAAAGYGQDQLPYWRNSVRSGNPPAKELTDLYRETTHLRQKYLLSPDLFAANDEFIEAQRQRFGALDVEKLRQLALIDATRMDQQLSRLGRGSSQPGESRWGSSGRDEADRIEQERMTAVKSLLTPTEYADFELRASALAQGLRYRLDAFQPTEAEYRALYAVEKQYQEAARTPAADAALRDSYEAALQAALGADRYADYEALRKGGSDQLPRLMNRLNLPIATVTVLNAVRDQTTRQAAAITGNPQLTPAERSAQLEALARQAEGQLGDILGNARNLQAYADLKGEWLRKLRPPAPSGP